jgi:hypothetical protein
MAAKKELKLAAIHLPLENKIQKVIQWDGWPCPSDHKHEGKKNPELKAHNMAILP